ncbi:centromere-associated protein E-like [Enoplosus armatus]|uniref:centromere-associated protein E-like n=1 Tax=Enoplosus armatus TaxID=215367 RepID=UPI0039928828
MPGYSSEVQTPTTTNCPDTDLDSLIPKSENLQEDHDKRETDFKVEVSNKSVGATLEGMDKSDTLQSQDVRGAHHSEDAVNKVHEQEVEPTEIQEMPQIVTYDATENFEIISGNLMEQAEISDTYQSEFIVKSTYESDNKQSNSDDKQDEHPMKVNNFEALDHRNEDYHIYDTKKPQISDIEWEDTALGQVYETEGRVEDDAEPSAEQTLHQEKEGLFSETEESESSLQTLQSEIHAPLDSQPQQTDAGFNPIGNRRKLGSSRRNKGRQHVKDSVAESCHRPTEEVVGTTRDNEPLETTKMSLTIETTVQEKSMETMQEGMDKFDTHQTEEVGDQIQNALVGISELNSSTLHPSSTVDQLINQTNSTEMPEEELPYVYSVTEKENKERDEDAELLRLDGNLPENYLVSESHLKSEDIESSITPAISTDKHSPREHTEPKCSVEQADFSSPKQELPTNDEQNQILNLSEVGVPYQSEDAVNKVPEQDFKPTQMQEIAYSSESVIHDATENSEIISGNLMDQAEVSDTYQSELIGKSTDESAAKQEDSNPDDKHDDPPTKDRNFEALENRNEDYHNIKKPQISDIKRVDTALGQVYEGKDQVEDDIKSSAEQTGRQDKEGVFSDMEESESSLQTLQSERNISLDSQPQQTDTGFNPIGNRRKLGSSRRNKGRHHVKESVAESYYEHKEEVVITTSANESLETTQMLLAIERTNLEELSQGREHDILMPATHDRSLYTAIMPGYSSEVQTPTTTNYPETDLDSLIPKSENLQEDHVEREFDFKVEVSNKSVGATLEGMDKSDTLQSQDVRGAHHSEDAVNKVHEQEVEPTEIQEMPQIDYSSKSVTYEATEKFEIISGNLMEQAEISDTYQSELIVKSTDESAAKHEDSNPDDKHDDPPTKERNFEALDHRNEDYHNIKKPQMSVIKTADTAVGQVYEGEGQVEDDTEPSAEHTVHQEKEGLFSEMEEDRFETAQTEEVSDQVKENAHLVHISELNSSILHPSPTADQQMIGRSNFRDMPEELPYLYSITEEEDKESDEDTELSITLDVLVQEEAPQVQNTEASSCDKDSLGQEMNMQQTNDAIEAAGDVMIKDYHTEAENSIDVQVSGQDEIGETFEDPTKKDCEAQEMNASQEITHAALNKTDTLAPFDIGLEDNFKAERAVDVSEESGINRAVGASNSQQGIREETHLDNSENSQGKSKQKRRKMGSTRQSQLNRKPEGGMDNKEETKESKEMEELPMIVTAEVSQNADAKPSPSPVYKEQETNETSTVHDKGLKLQSSTSDLQSIQSDMMSDVDDLKVLLPEQSASHNEEAVNAVKFLQVSDSEEELEKSRRMPRVVYKS